MSDYYKKTYEKPILKTAEAATGKWRGILMSVGVDESFLKNVHGPCPACGGKNRFRFDDKDGHGTFYCNQCEIIAGDGFALLKNLKGWPFERAAREVDAIIGNIPLDTKVASPAAQKDIQAILKRLYAESRPIRKGDVAWTYLESRCGEIGGMVSKLRLHPSLRHKASGLYFPTLLSPMRHGAEGHGVGYHRTYLTPEGTKAPVEPCKMNLGDAATIELGPAMEEMGIGEGIESSLCAAQIKVRPIWAAGCSGMLKKWNPPAVAKSIYIMADHDPNFVGQLAAFELASRLRNQGLQVEVFFPPETGADWADVYKQMRVSA
jgi:putative DNA primase/helicase